MTITTCDECAVGIVNDDWTHLDYHHDKEAADMAYTSITATMELLGWLTHNGDANEPGYFNCELCSEIQCGGGHTFQSEKNP